MTVQRLTILLRTCDTSPGTSSVRFH